MLRSSYFQDLLTSIFERRSNVSKNSNHSEVTAESSDLPSLCQQLLFGKGEVSEMSTAAEIMRVYHSASTEQKNDFFLLLANNYDIDLNEVQNRLDTYRRTGSPKDLSLLLAAAEPVRQDLLRRINRAPGATQHLVKMREELFSLMKGEVSLQRVDIDFQHLFSSWFNRGFLVLQPIDWKTPANILEKIIEYEAVHEIDDWSELRRRLEPSDRRCYAFFHPAMPTEPLIFVEVALTTSIPGAVDAVLSEDREHVAEQDASTAVFYSISNCQKGLRGVSFGNFLIKQVAKELSLSLPNLNTFVTLSPIPGFVAWLKRQAEADITSLYASVYSDIRSRSPDNREVAIKAKKRVLLPIVAHYLLTERHKDGLAADPVARFHLGNGASLDAIHFEANMSEKGISQSYGMMVNYRYDLTQVEDNHEAYVTRGEISAPAKLYKLAKAKESASQEPQ